MRGGFRLPTDGFLTDHLEVQTLAGPSSDQPKRGDEDLFAMPFLDRAADDSRRMDTEKILKKYVRPWIFTGATGYSHEISASGSTDPESLDFQTEFDPSFGWMHSLSFSLWDSKLTMMNPILRICSRQPSPPRHHT